MSKELYLGKREDDTRLDYDPDNFVTHGVILGMTGSGKTGLALGMLEEMVEAGIPILAIDPKGDLPNLALIFPRLEPSDFESWTDPSEASREGITVKELATRKADLWKTGLAKWELDGSHLEAVRSQMDLRILTPGSTALTPVNLLGSFSPPPADIPETEKADLASGIITGLLSLVADNVDPLRDPRHVLLVQILSNAWAAGNSLSLEELIGQLVDPPFAKVGVFPVDRFFSPDDRMKLAMQLNTLVASPTFAAWKEGVSLDIGVLMERKDGKVPVNIFCLAHLSEKERHFFVGRLMNEVLAWTRTLPGSGSLRALVYFDEVAGYLPPHPYNPPAKQPLLTMLKQSRAVGVGVCLATQNPVDIDYKALSNMGTWMIGRLQTEQDRNRVRDGLISASGGLTAKEVEEEFSKIQPRSFLLKAPKENKPVLFRTRWAMSYLRGPVTLAELPRLEVQGLPTESADSSATTAGSQNKGSTQYNRTPPPVPKDFGQSFFDPRYVFHYRLHGLFEQFSQSAREDGTVLHRPALHAVLRLQFDESKDNFILHTRHHYLAFPLDRGGSIAERFCEVTFEEDDFLNKPPDEAVFESLPEDFDESSELKQAQDELCDRLYRTLTATRFINEKVRLYSKPEEDREAFWERCAEEAEKLADEAAVKVRAKLQKQLERVEKQLVSAKDRVEHLALSEKSKKVEGLWKAGEVLLGLFTKRRKSFSSVLTKSRMALEADNRTRQAEEKLVRLQEEMMKLQTDLELQLGDLEQEYADYADRIEEREIRLNKSDINVERFQILWIPVSKRL